MIYSREDLVGKRVLVSRKGDEGRGTRKDEVRFPTGTLDKEGESYVLKRKSGDTYVLKDDDKIYPLW